jgi:hypothetical protein
MNTDDNLWTTIQSQTLGSYRINDDNRNHFYGRNYAKTFFMSDIPINENGEWEDAPSPILGYRTFANSVTFNNEYLEGKNKHDFLEEFNDKIATGVRSVAAEVYYHTASSNIYMRRIQLLLESIVKFKVVGDDDTLIANEINIYRSKTNFSFWKKLEFLAEAMRGDISLPDPSSNKFVHLPFTVNEINIMDDENPPFDIIIANHPYAFKCIPVIVLNRRIDYYDGNTPYYINLFKRVMFDILAHYFLDRTPNGFDSKVEKLMKLFNMDFIPAVATTPPNAPNLPVGRGRKRLRDSVASDTDKKRNDIHFANQFSFHFADILVVNRSSFSKKKEVKKLKTYYVSTSTRSRQKKKKLNKFANQEYSDDEDEYELTFSEQEEYDRIENSNDRMLYYNTIMKDAKRIKEELRKEEYENEGVIAYPYRNGDEYKWFLYKENFYTNEQQIESIIKRVFQDWKFIDFQNQTPSIYDRCRVTLAEPVVRITNYVAIQSLARVHSQIKERGYILSAWDFTIKSLNLVNTGRKFAFSTPSTYFMLFASFVGVATGDYKNAIYLLNSKLGTAFDALSVMNFVTTFLDHLTSELNFNGRRGLEPMSIEFNDIKIKAYAPIQTLFDKTSFYFKSSTVKKKKGENDSSFGIYRKLTFAGTSLFNICRFLFQYGSVLLTMVKVYNNLVGNIELLEQVEATMLVVNNAYIKQSTMMKLNNQSHEYVAYATYGMKTVGGNIFNSVYNRFFSSDITPSNSVPISVPIPSSNSVPISVPNPQSYENLSANVMMIIKGWLSTDPIPTPQSNDHIPTPQSNDPIPTPQSKKMEEMDERCRVAGFWAISIASTITCGKMVDPNGRIMDPNMHIEGDFTLELDHSIIPKILTGNSTIEVPPLTNPTSDFKEEGEEKEEEEDPTIHYQASNDKDNTDLVKIGADIFTLIGGLGLASSLGSGIAKTTKTLNEIVRITTGYNPLQLALSLCQNRNKIERVGRGVI